MNKRIIESVEEDKFIPTGSEFTELFSLYKTVPSHLVQSYVRAFDRKLSDGYNRNGNNCYGDGVYLTFNLESASRLLGSYGDAIIQVKLLGGFKGFVFFDTGRDNFIKNLQIKTYGKPLTVEEQLYEITGNHSDAAKYSKGGYYNGEVDSSTFGTRYARQLRRKGYNLRGIVYMWNGFPVALPFNFGDIITCAAAEHLSRYDSVDTIRKKMHGVLDAASRKSQGEWLDVVPQLEMIDAKNENALYKRCMLNRKCYVAYENAGGGKFNLVELDDEHPEHPHPKFIIPRFIHVQQLPDLPGSQDGMFTFYADGILWYATVCHEVTKGPALWSPELDDWLPFEEYDYALNLAKNGAEEDGNEGQRFVAESLVLNEAFSTEMTKEDFLSKNPRVVYVCAHADSVQAIFKNGFSRQFCNANDYMHNGGALTYGDGQYGTPSLQNAANNLSQKRDYGKSDGYKYGSVILKCVLLGSFYKFLIFDENLAKQIYKDKWQIFDQIDWIIKDNPEANRELKHYCQQFLGRELYNPSNDSMRRTNHILFSMFNNPDGFKKWTEFFRKCGIRGGVYHGHGDGYCFVCYNFSEVIPVAASYDHGQTFTDKDFDYDRVKQRLSFDNDPRQKYGHLFKKMSPFSVKVTCGGKVFGVTQVETRNGKYNLLINNTGEKVSPYDFDIEPTISTGGTITFTYRGYDLQGTLMHETAEIPAFWFDPFETWYSFSDLNEVINAYENQSNEEQGYEEQDDAPSREVVEESFYKLFDKLELL